MQEIIIGRSEKDREKYGTAGTVLLGKQYITMGRTTSLANSLYLDITRSHVFFICGKRGSGKCLHGDTLITLNNGSQVKIKDLENDNNEVFTLDSNLKIREWQKTNFFKRPVNKLLEIKLRSGKIIKLTPEHPLLTVKGWLPAEKLHPGSRIATPRKIDAFGDRALEECKVKLLAYLIAEGHLGNGFVLFSNNDNKIVNDFSKAIYEFDNNLIINIHSKPGCFRIVENRHRSGILAKRDCYGKFIKGSRFNNKSSIRLWLEEIKAYGKKSPDKFIPSIIFNMPKHQIGLFLNRLFSCDGTIFKKQNHWFVSYCSSSEQLITQVQHLLLRFGIISRIKKRTIKTKNKIFSSNELYIYGAGVNQYLQEIGFYGKKEERAKKALEESVKIIRNPNVDTIPREIWEMYAPQNWAEIGRKIGYTNPKSIRTSIDYSPSRQKLLLIAKTDESELLEKFATSDIFWDEIIGMNFLDGNFEVYDLTVPETHNFVANDIIVHNSYTMGAIAEGMADLPVAIRQNLSFIFLDTMGIYWTMRYPNKKDEDLLIKWGFKAKALDVKIFTPYKYYDEYRKKGIPTDYAFSLNAYELEAAEWQMTFEISPNEPVGVLIERVIYTLKENKGKYYIDDIINAIKKEEHADQTTKDAAINRFLTTKGWGVFAEEGEGTPLKRLSIPGQVSVLDVSCYATMAGGWKIKHLIVGLVAQKLFVERMIARKNEEYEDIKTAIHYFTEEARKEKLEQPLVWLVLDEAHEFLPREGKNPATDPLVTILREGRQPGISLILASQQPGKIHTDVMTQADTVLSHRITAKMDVEALGLLMQSYMREGLDVQLNNLPRMKGACVLFDDTNERLYMMQVRPRFTWHGGEAPIAMPKEKKGL